MAAQPEGHAPEINQFHVSESGVEDDASAARSANVDRLLRAAVTHLALIRITGSKPGSESDTKAYDSMLHPIFSPFFAFSFRRKRKMALSEAELIGLVEKPRKTIGDILDRHGRDLAEEALPEQLELFASFYGT
jgi:hypothetical protein